MGCVSRKDLMMEDIKMLVIVGENAAPIAVTVEPLNKGHLRTVDIVPYSEVVPYWEIFQKK